jgi:hypothetical protein
MRSILAFLLAVVGCCDAAVVNKVYPLTNDPIDVVIVTHPKDKDTLDMCIDGIRTYGENIGRVFVVSSEPLTEKAEWFNEANYPFTKADISLEIGRGDKAAGEAFFARGGHPVGWYYQQLLKLYAAYVIPGISPNVLVIDSDSVFVSPVEFIDDKGGLLCVNIKKATKSHYRAHAQRMLPSYAPIHLDVNSVNHHMLFQKPILDDMFAEIETAHNMPLWKVFCQNVDTSRKWGSGSEYELYYNFALNHTSQVSIRPLKRRSSGSLHRVEEYQEQGYSLLSFHSYMRKE